MSTKPSIPTVPTTDSNLSRFVDAVKQTLDAMTGKARNVQRLEPLPPTATLAEVIERLNQVISRLQ